jgi:HPt (histidine-containing phosphotransfer) domain-containing protein
MSQSVCPAHLQDPAYIDLRIFAKSLGEDYAMLLEFITERYLKSTQLGIDEMLQALSNYDLLQLKRLGHKHKSSAKTVGAMGLAELFLAIEKLTEPSYQDMAVILLRDLQLLLNQIRDLIFQGEMR